MEPSLLLFFDFRFNYPLGLLSLPIQIGLCRPVCFRVWIPDIRILSCKYLSIFRACLEDLRDFYAYASNVFIACYEIH